MLRPRILVFLQGNFTLVCERIWHAETDAQLLIKVILNAEGQRTRSYRPSVSSSITAPPNDHHTSFGVPEDRSSDGENTLPDRPLNQEVSRSPAYDSVSMSVRSVPERHPSHEALSDSVDLPSQFTAGMSALDHDAELPQVLEDLTFWAQC